MKSLPIAQREFAFVAQTFCLIQDTVADGERLARLREEAEVARAANEAAQTHLPLKPRVSKKRSVKGGKRERLHA